MQKKTGLAFATLLAIICSFISSVKAQSSAFTYQGRLNDNGAPANGGYDFLFTIYDAATNGNAASVPQTNFAITVSNGQFTTQLDFGASPFNGNLRWIDIGVRTNGAAAFSSLNPRQQLTSTPYAIQAANASNATTAAVANTANSISAANIAGSLSFSQLPASVLTNGASGVTLAGTFSGNGNSLSNLNATNLIGTIADARHSTNVALLSNPGAVNFVTASNGLFVDGNRVVAGTVGRSNLAVGAVDATILTNGAISSSHFAAGAVDNAALAANAVNGSNIINGAVLRKLNGFTDTVVLTNMDAGLGIVNLGTNQIGFATASWNINGNSLGAGGPFSIGAKSTNAVQIVVNNSRAMLFSPTTVSTQTVNIIGGSALNAISNNAAGVTISGGGGVYQSATNINSVGADFGTISGGAGNTIASGSTYSIIGGGNANTIQTNATNSVLAGGYLNQIQSSASNSAIAGGMFNIISNNAANAAIGGGSGNVAAGQFATVPGGVANSAAGNYSFAAGRFAKANHQGAFVWADSQNGNFVSSTNDQFLIRAQGNVGINKTNPATALDVNGTITATAFAGNALGMTNISSSQLSGTINIANLPSVLVTNGEKAVNLSGTFSGNGSDITGIDLRTANSAGAITYVTNSSGFSSVTGYSVVSQPATVITADLNGDGNLDIITANYGNSTLSILANQGNATFSPASNISLGAGNTPQSVVAADVNGDGVLDLCAATTGSNTVFVLTNNGSGGFTQSSTVVVGANPYSIVAADVNLDGKIDLITANMDDSTLSVLTNNGNGIFTLSTNLSVSNARNVVAFDINGDGKVDLMSANAAGSANVVIYTNNNGVFTLRAIITAGNNAQALAVADFNGDGKMDFAAGNTLAGKATVMTNDGAGNFAIFASLTTGNQPMGVAAADINKDGKVDLVSANFTGNSFSVFTNSGTGFILATTMTTSGPEWITMADLNHDNMPDLIAPLSLFNSVVVYTNLATYTGSFIGNGGALTGLNAANLVNTISDARLSSNVPLLNGGNVFTGANQFAGVTIATNANNQLAGAFTGTASGTFTGNGNGLTALNATNLTGTIADARVSTNVPLKNAANTFSAQQNFSVAVASPFTVTSTNKVTNLNADQLDGIDSSGFALASHTHAASAIISGALNDARLSPNVPLLNAANLFSGLHNRFANPVGINLGSGSPMTPLHIKQTTDGSATEWSGGLRLEMASSTNAWSIFTWSDNDLAFRFNGGAYAYISDVNGAYGSSSDRRLKKDIQPLTSMLEKVLALRPVSYRFIKESDTSRKSFGFIAQDVEPIFPNLVSEKAGYKGLTYSSFIPVAVGAIQELDSVVQKKDTQICELREEINLLKKQIATQQQVNHKLEANFERMEKALQSIQFNAPGLNKTAIRAER